MNGFDADTTSCSSKGGCGPQGDVKVTLGQAIQKAAFKLKDRTDTPRLDAEVLLSFCLNISREAIYRDWQLELEPLNLEIFSQLVARRAGREPVAYITGVREFWGREFIVRPGVLIPRPETELLVEEAVRLLQRAAATGGEGSVLRAADVGTGSGAIAVSLACAVPGLKVYATDISPLALQTAAENIERHGVASRVALFQSDLLENLPNIEELDRLPGEQRCKLQVICANLPYIPSGEMGALMEDVRLYEPEIALDGGTDGLELYRRLLPRAVGLLSAGGCLLMEIGPGQGEVLRLAAGPGWHCVIKKDLAGRERLVLAIPVF